MKKTIIGLFISLLVINTTFSACETEKEDYKQAQINAKYIETDYYNIEDEVDKELEGTMHTTSYRNAIINKRKSETWSKLTSAQAQVNYNYNKLNLCLEENTVEEKTSSTIQDIEGNALFQEGYDALQRKDYKTAVSKYEEYLKKYPVTRFSSSIEARDNLFLGYINQAEIDFYKENYDSSIEYYKKAINIYPTNFSVNFGLGANYSNLEDYESALWYYELAFEYATEKADIDKSRNKINTIKNILNNNLNENLIGNNEEEIKQKTEIAFSIIKETFKTSKQKEAIFLGLKSQLEKLKNNYSGDKLVMINYLIILINQEI